MAQFDAEITKELTSIAKKTSPQIRVDGRYIVIEFGGQSARILASTSKVISNRSTFSR
jgi:hypothetical protein